MLENRPAEMEGMFVVIENGDFRGLKNCCDYLARRGITGVISIGADEIDGEPRLIRELSDKGFEIGGKISPELLSNEPYEHQVKLMSSLQDKIRRYINKPMRVMLGKHFLHNEASIRAANELGVDYILIRGAGGSRTVIYKPVEYATKVISVSMIPAGTGFGSVCEHVPWATGQTPEDFRQILFGLREDKVTVAIHTNLGGVKLRWWNVYQEFLDKGSVTWKSLDEFTSNPVVLPATEIPRNSEVTYGTPTPRIPLEQEPEYEPEEL